MESDAYACDHKHLSLDLTLCSSALCLEILCILLQKQDDCQHEAVSSAPTEMDGELLISMVTRAVTAIMSRLNTLSNSDVPESKVCSSTLLCAYVIS